MKRSFKTEIHLKTKVWNFLELMYDDATWPNTDPIVCVDELWGDRWLGLQDLVVAQDEINVAADGGSLFGSDLDDEAMEHPTVMAMLAAPQVITSIISQGINALRTDHWDQLLDWFENATGDTRAAIAMVIASSEIKSSDSRAGKLLILAISDDTDDVSLRTMGYSLHGLGKATAVSDDAVQSVAKIAADRRLPQPIRSVAIESLMDMGPAAKSATELLQDLRENDEDEDLRQFAWAALKSVTASSREHPEGGTVADHMRRLYLAENDE